MIPNYDHVLATSALAGQPPISAEVFHDALDEHFVLVGDHAWLVQVFGIHTAEDGRWLQLELLGDSGHELLLHMPLSAKPAQALAVIEDWLRAPDRCDGEVIRVGIQ